jgi:hypothetical protein
MTQTVIHLFPSRHAVLDPAEASRQDEALIETLRQRRLKVASAISLCLTSLIEDAEGADLSITTAGLLVAIDAASIEAGRI